MRKVHILVLSGLLLLTACRTASVPEGTELSISSSPIQEVSAVPTISAAPKEIVITEAPSSTPAPTSAPTATPTPEPSPTPVPEPFRMVWASDTQIMLARYKEMLGGYTAMCDWIVEHAESDRIKVFLHSGDMVDGCDNLHQWQYFSEGVARIQAHMPLFMTAGNHDYYSNTRKSYWKRQFFVKEFPPEQSYDECEAAYMILSVDSTDLLLISVCFREQKDQGHLAWLKDVCDAHPELPAILVVHGYLSKEGELMDAAKNMEQLLVSQCPNIRLILCGHSRGVARTAFVYDDNGDGTEDRTVNVLMCDLQEDLEKYGYMNILTYDPLRNSLSVESYSPFLDDYICDDEHPDLERFVVENVF